MSTLFPKRIEIDNASIAQLELLFTVATNDLQNYLFTLNGHVISKGQIMLLRQQSHQRIQKLGNDVGEWITKTVPYSYAQGQHDAARQQSHLGDKVAAGIILGAIAHRAFASPPVAGGEVITSAEPKIFDLHAQSIDTIMKDMSASFGNSLTSLSRSIDGVISRVQSLGIRRTIAEAAKQGSSVDAISKSITDLLDNANIYGLVDKSGRQWAPDVYARMLTRTKLVEARNAGMMNSILSIGGDLVQVSAHGAIDQCGPWEGKILSISGSNKYYESVQDAYSGGLFHPNCEHSLNTVNEALLPNGRPKAMTV